jgi:hypothetical protein
LGKFVPLQRDERDVSDLEVPLLDKVSDGQVEPAIGQGILALALCD